MGGLAESPTQIGTGTPTNFAAGSIVFSNGQILTENNGSLFWDNTNHIFKLNTEGSAIRIGSVSGQQPFQVLTGHYVNNSTNDPYIAIGYNIAGGVASASNPIQSGVQQVQIAIEGNWNPTGAYTQVEFNHDYWSPDGLTHRRAFLHQLRNDTFVGNWLWYGDTHSWSNSDNSQTWMQLNSGGLNLTNVTGFGVGTAILTGTTNIYNNSANPCYVINCSGSAANNRLWDIFLSGTTLEFRLVNDAVSAATDWLSCNRTANTSNTVAITATTTTVSGALRSTGNNASDLGASANQWANVWFGTQALGGNGSAASPTFSLINSTNTGIYWDANNAFLDVSISGTAYMGIAGNTLQLASGVVLGWTTGIGTVASDVTLKRTGAKALQILSDATGSLGFFNATPATQQTQHAVTAGYTAGASTSVTIDGSFTGNTGATKYTIGDIVAALKNYGLLVS